MGSIAPYQLVHRRAPLYEAFTLLELLVVVAIIAVLVSILMPAMAGARNEASTAKCVANIRGITQATAMYMDAEERRILPWYQYPEHAAFRNEVRVCTPWVFGGFKAPNPDASDAYVDSSLYPAQLRPLNAFVAPDVTETYAENDRGRAVIEIYKCPADRSNSTSIISEPPASLEEEAKASWEANGSSSTLNTRWAQGYTHSLRRQDRSSLDRR
jgi:prepilin-type N-terminal cleavage/methylation domain-containing protein